MRTVCFNGKTTARSGVAGVDSFNQGNWFMGLLTAPQAPQGGSDNNALARMLAGALPEVRQMWFNQRRLIIDGYHFVGCRFDGCTLVASTTNFVLQGCMLDSSTSIEIGGNLLKVVQLYNVRPPSVFGPQPPFVPIRHPDGTISIGA